MNQISQEELFVIPTWAAVVVLLDDSGIARKVLDVHPDLTECELPGAIEVESPPVRVADPVDAA